MTVIPKKFYSSAFTLLTLDVHKEKWLVTECNVNLDHEKMQV